MSLLPPSEASRNLFTRLSYIDLALTRHPEAFLPNTSTTDPFSPAALLRIAAGRELTTIDDIKDIPTEVKLQLVPQLDTIGAAVWGNHVFQDMKRESAALQLPPNLGATPEEQVTYEEDLVNGAAFVYPFGQISWGIARVLAAAHRNTKGVFRYATMFSNPKFGDEAKNREAVHKDGAVPRLGKTKFEGHEAMPVPYEHAQLYLRNSKTIVLAPVADGLPTLLTDENIIALLSNTNEQVDLFTAIKGLDPEGRSAMEVIKFRIEEMKARLQARDPERKFPKIKIIDVLGYYPVKVVQKALEEGDAPPDLRLVFACEDEAYAKELVAKYSSQNIQVRAVPAKAVKAVELASIYKNFLGIHLGKLLFEEAHKVLFKKNDPIYQKYSQLEEKQRLEILIPTPEAITQLELLMGKEVKPRKDFVFKHIDFSKMEV